jgi:hypothetical protein
MFRKIIRIGIGASLVATAPLVQASLLGSWSFEGEQPQVVKDNSGNGNDGQVVGEATYVEGIHGKALSFNGDGVYVELGHGAANSPLSLAGTSYTITCWVMFNSIEGHQRIFNKDNGEDYKGGYALSVDEGMLKLTTNDGSNRNINISGVSTHVWCFIAVVYDQSTGSRKVYINGDIVADDKIGSEGLHSREADPLWFGGIQKYGQYLSGVLDEVRIYDEALSSARISELIADPATDAQKR